MKKTLIIFFYLCVLVCGQDWQDEQTVAIYMFGQEPKGALGSHKKIGSELVEAINMSGKFSAINITNNLKNLRVGVVSNELITSIALQFGVQYLYIVKISEVTSSMFELDVRLVNLATTQTINTTTLTSDLSSSSERVNIARKIAQELVDVLVDVPEDVEEDVQPESFANDNTTITMDNNLPLTTNYYTLTTNANPVYGGSVSRNPDYNTYPAWEQVTVTAIPYSGYAFSHWSGALLSEDYRISITMRKDMTLTANFRKKINSLGIGVFGSLNTGGGIKWDNGEKVAMPYDGLGGYLFFSREYIEAFVGASYFGGYWESTDVSVQRYLPDMQRSYINGGVFVKYPIGDGKIKLFPLVGIDYEASIFGKLKPENGSEYIFDGESGHPQASTLSVLWIKLGVGYDLYLTDNVYLRYELLYGFRTTSVFEEEYAAKNYSVGVNWNTRLGHGLTFKVGLGLILF
jgi:hypothetical protein